MESAQAGVSPARVSRDKHTGLNKEGAAGKPKALLWFRCGLCESFALVLSLLRLFRASRGPQPGMPLPAHTGSTALLRGGRKQACALAGGRSEVPRPPQEAENPLPAPDSWGAKSLHSLTTSRATQANGKRKAHTPAPPPPLGKCSRKQRAFSEYFGGVEWVTGMQRIVASCQRI